MSITVDQVVKTGLLASIVVFLFEERTIASGFTHNSIMSFLDRLLDDLTTRSISADIIL